MGNIKSGSVGRVGRWGDGEMGRWGDILRLLNQFFYLNVYFLV
ncbi:hypothetical protein [Okeania sp. SIO2C9]|nr:hypothetical protein [Okeania sp. SIO2C9]